MNCHPVFMGMFICICSCCPVLALASDGGVVPCARAPFAVTNVPTAHNASTIWRRPNPMGNSVPKTYVVQRIPSMHQRDRQLTRCLHAEGKRATVKCESGTWGGVRPNAEARRSGGYQRGSAIHRNDGMKRLSRRRRVVRRRDGGPVVIMATRDRHVRDVSSGRGAVMTGRRTRDGVAM